MCHTRLVELSWSNQNFLYMKWNVQFFKYLTLSVIFCFAFSVIENSNEPDNVCADDFLAFVTTIDQTVTFVRIETLASHGKSGITQCSVVILVKRKMIEKDGKGKWFETIDTLENGSKFHSTFIRWQQTRNTFITVKTVDYCNRALTTWGKSFAITISDAHWEKRQSKKYQHIQKGQL